MEVKTGQIYRHFKGDEMEVLMLARCSETLEKLVIYRDLSTGEIWSRPLVMFCSRVDKDKYPDVRQEYRFELIKDEK